MKSEVPTVGAAIVFTLLCMGVVGMFVLLPIACIQWTWNSVITSLHELPLINVWQATLLYMAAGTILYLTGILRVEFGPKGAE